MSKKQVKSISKEIVNKALIDSLKKFDPRVLIKNPVIFVVEIGFFLTLILTINPSLFTENEADLRIFNGIISFILFITVIFANFAESIAEGRGKAQADSLKKTRKETSANLLNEDAGEG